MAGRLAPLIDNVVCNCVGVVLASAAVLKWHQAWTEPSLVLIDSFFVAQVLLWVPIEFFVGVWLASGLFRSSAMLASLVIFAGFTTYTAILLVSGVEKCGCFGAVEVPILWTLIIDSVVLLALLGIAFNRGFGCRRQRVNGNIEAANEQILRNGDIEEAVKRGAIPSFRRFFVSSAFCLLAFCLFSLWVVISPRFLVRGFSDSSSNSNGHLLRLDEKQLPKRSELFSKLELSSTELGYGVDGYRAMCVLYRSECRHCQEILSKLEVVSDLIPWKIYLIDISDHRPLVQHPAENAWAFFFKKQSRDHWVVSVPSVLFYKGEDPVHLSDSPKHLGEITWPN